MVTEQILGFAALSTAGEFLVKDIALLGISTWTLADSLTPARPRAH